MSEIDKLYENAGVEHINFAKQGAIDFTNTIEIDGKRYPDFTSGKQIELIKWIMKYDEIHGDYNDGYGFSTLNYSGKYKKDFEESLASIINNELWQDLTEEEKQQVKGILE